MDDKIVVTGTVKNLTNKPVAYRVSLWNLLVYAVQPYGMPGCRYTQPDGTEGFPAWWPGCFAFHELGPRESTTDVREFTARCPGKYEAHFSIDSDTDMEEVYDITRFSGVFPPKNSQNTSAQSKPVEPPNRQPIMRKVPNVWFGNIEKKVFFGVTQEPPPFEIDVRSDKTSYVVGEHIMIEATVRNLLTKQVVYQAYTFDFVVYGLDTQGYRIKIGCNTPQPDDSIGYFFYDRVPMIVGAPNPDYYFEVLAPLENKVFKKEFVAYRTGKYEAVFGIWSRWNDSHIFGYDQISQQAKDRSETTVAQDKITPLPAQKNQKLKNVWLGVIPEKRVAFEVVDKK